MEEENGIDMHNFPTDDSETELDLDDELYKNAPFRFGESLSQEARDFLSLPTTDRDDYDTGNVLAELDKLDFFRKFKHTTKQKLCKRMLYGMYQNNSYLLKQNEDVFNIYVLLNGIVSLRYNALVLTATNGGAQTQWPERFLTKGAYFGHEDLLRHRPASVDAIVVGCCEVLMLSEDDLWIVKSVLKPEQVRLKLSIHSAKVLKKFKWSSEELEALEMFSKLDSYLETVEIYNGSDGTRPKWSRFLVEGECTLAREVSYYADGLGTTDLRFLAVQAGEMNRRILKMNLRYQTVKQGYFFGVGEDFGANRVFANPASECLSVLRQVLVFKNRGRLQLMADALMQSLLTDQDLLDNFWNGKK